jgi:hypothetical protein
MKDLTDRQVEVLVWIHLGVMFVTRQPDATWEPIYKRNNHDV